MLLTKTPHWPHARTANRVANDTVERHTFNSAAEIVGFYAEAETFIRIGDGAVDIPAYNANDVVRIPAGHWTVLSLVGWAERGPAKTRTTVAFRAPVNNRLQIMEWDNPEIDVGATGGSY